MQRANPAPCPSPASSRGAPPFASMSPELLGGGGGIGGCGGSVAVVEVFLAAPALPTRLYRTTPCAHHRSARCMEGGGNSRVVEPWECRPAHACGTGGGGARRESAVTWALVFGEGTLGVGWVGAHAEMRRPAPPSPSHHSHRAFPAVPEPVMEHRHGGSALGAPYRPLSPLPEGGKEGE